MGVKFLTGVKVVEEMTEDTADYSTGVYTRPTIVGTGGGIGIGVVLTTV